MLVHPPKARPGDRVAVVPASFAAPAAGPAVHEQAMRRLAELTEHSRDAAIEAIGRYNPGAVVCVGVPFGHTRPQWIVPHGGEITLDGAAQRVWADYR
ncbi:hypothetical protein [Agromyces cavernae]|uniref:hypothetical protein n=1 Tax=Agromyces cavernae TaxID=2898659 RepID=UPI003558CD41